MGALLKTNRSKEGQVTGSSKGHPGLRGAVCAGRFRVMIGFIGGTGPEGRGLGLRLALAGHDVMIGSRDAARAAEAAERVVARAPEASVLAGLNEDVAERAETVFVTVPYPAQRSALGPLAGVLAGKIVVTTVVPLGFDAGGARFLPIEAGSAAMEAREMLPDSRIVAAFQTVSAHDLLNLKRRVDSDVVVCSDDDEAKEAVSGLAEEIPGIRAVDGGGLRNAVFVEHITPLILNVNRIYGGRAAIRLTGIGEESRGKKVGGRE